MNIEKQIKDLTDAIVRLTEVMEFQLNGKPASKPDPEDPFDERNPDNSR